MDADRNDGGPDGLSADPGEHADELVRKAFQYSNDAIFVIDIEADEIRDVNRRTCRLLGYDREALVGSSPETIHPDEVTAFRSFVASVMEEGGGYTDELTCLTKSGRRIPAEISASTITVEGRPHLLAFVHDTAERDRHREGIAALARASRRIQRAGSTGGIAESTVDIAEAVLDHGLSGVWLYDADRDVLVPEQVTESARELLADFGLDLEALVFEPGSIEMDVFERGEPTVVEDYGSVENPGVPGHALGTVFITPLGKHGVLNIANAAVREVSETERDLIEILAGHATAALDRTQRERELSARNDELILLNRIVRHDIRNDMMISAGWLEQIRDDVDPAIRDRLDTVIESVEHTVELTEIVGDVIEIMTETGDFDLSAVDLVHAVESEVERCREAHAGAAIEFEAGTDRLPVRANAMVSSVVRNLINNAIQHNDKADPEVEVTVEADGDGAVLRVADNGPGIAEERKAALFEHDHQGLDSEGLGLGLYLVATLVDAYGGEVSVSDNDPHGTVFEVRFERAG